MGREIHTVDNHLFTIGVDFVTELRIAVNLLPIDMHIVVVAAHLIIARHDIPVGMHLETTLYPSSAPSAAVSCFNTACGRLSAWTENTANSAANNKTDRFIRYFFRLYSIDQPSSIPFRFSSRNNIGPEICKMYSETAPTTVEFKNPKNDNRHHECFDHPYSIYSMRNQF